METMEWVRVCNLAEPGLFVDASLYGVCLCTVTQTYSVVSELEQKEARGGGGARGGRRKQEEEEYTCLALPNCCLPNGGGRGTVSIVEYYILDVVRKEYLRYTYIP